MKLRNKKTGEIVRVEFLNNWQTDDGTEIGFRECNTNIVYSYNSLSELIEEWEDVPEKPKEYWYIDTTEGAIVEHTSEQFELTDKERKEIGNYFETKEEAEKAVEKLKAWKRLKDKGFKFQFWTSSYKGADISFFIDWVNADSKKETENDLDLLFGGEE